MTSCSLVAVPADVTNEPGLAHPRTIYIVPLTATLTNHHTTAIFSWDTAIDSSESSRCSLISILIGDLGHFPWTETFAKVISQPSCSNKQGVTPGYCRSKCSFGKCPRSLTGIMIKILYLLSGDCCGYCLGKYPDPRNCPGKYPRWWTKFQSKISAPGLLIEIWPRHKYGVWLQASIIYRDHCCE